MDLLQTGLCAQREERNSWIPSKECYAMEPGTYMLLQTWIVVSRSSRICCKAGESRQIKTANSYFAFCIRHAENAADEQHQRQERSRGALTSCSTWAPGISQGQTKKQSSSQKLHSKSWHSKLHHTRIVSPLPKCNLTFSHIWILYATDHRWKLILRGLVLSLKTK